MEDDKPDTSELWKHLQVSADNGNTGASIDTTDSAAAHTVDSEADPLKNPEKSTSATLPSHVKLVVNELEFRYSSRVCPPTQPPPALQSCPKITALRDTLILKVRDPGTSKILPSEFESCPKVTAVRDTLVSRVQVPATTKISTPILQSCPKITSLQETLISRVQDPRTSQTLREVEQDLAHCPSVASRQKSLMNVARQSPAQRRTATTTSITRQRSLGDEPDDGLRNSTYGPETDRLKVALSDCQDVLRDEVHKPGDVLPNNRDGSKWHRLEDGTSNPSEKQGDDLLNCRDGPDCGVRNVRNLLEGVQLNSNEKTEECEQSVSGDVPENALPSSYGDGTDNNSNPNCSSQSVLNSNFHSAAANLNAETLPENEQLVLESTSDLTTCT